MAESRMALEVHRSLIELELESLVPKLDALGVRTLRDLELVDDADLVRWGLSTIQRRRFFKHVREVLGTDGDGLDASAALVPASALTKTVTSKRAGGSVRKARPDASSSAIGPARLDELLGRGSAEHQVPRLAERLLATTGPLDITELANRLTRLAPALAQGYDDFEWPQFVEACVRSYKRLQIEEGILQGDRPVVSICGSILFSASEEVVGDASCWLRVVQGLATPRMVAVVACVCRASREVADGPEVWSRLLTRWYPKATLLNPDWVCQADLEKRLEEALENDYAFAALTKRLTPDTPHDISELIATLPQQTTPKALMKFMSRHPDNFKQSPDGQHFCISRTPSDLVLCADWKTVNPFRTPPLPRSGVVGLTNDKLEGKAPTMSSIGRPKALRDAEQADSGGPSTGGPAPPEAAATHQICQCLVPKQAFRLYHTGLLSQRSDQSKRGKLEAWEYFTESDSKCVMAPGDLCDLAENRVQSIRANDPAVVHELVAQTLEGLIYKVPFGFWNRRVRILSNALNASQLRIGREQRKKYERKLVEFMEWVKKERGFGYYQCECGARWKSGFSYEEIMQQCLSCGTFSKPYRIQDLESVEDRERRERGEPALKNQGRTNALGKAPMISFKPPTIEHTAGSTFRGNQNAKRSREDWEQPATGSWRPVRPRIDEGVRPSDAGLGGGGPPRVVPPRGGSQSTSVAASAPARTASPQAAPKAAAVAVAAAASAAASVAAQYTPGGGGFFARQRVGAAAVNNSDAASSTAAMTAPGSLEATGGNSNGGSSNDLQGAPATYTPGGGGFFARRRAPQANAEAGVSAANGDQGRPRSRSRSRGRNAVASNGIVPVAGSGSQPALLPPLVAASGGKPMDVCVDDFDPSLLGLSAEEAKNLGLISELSKATTAAPSSTQQEQLPQHQGHDPALLTLLGFSEEEARSLGLISGPATITAAAHQVSQQQQQEYEASLLGLSAEEARNLGLISEPPPVTAPTHKSSQEKLERDAFLLGFSAEEARSLGLIPDPSPVTSAQPSSSQHHEEHDPSSMDVSVEKAKTERLPSEPAAEPSSSSQQKYDDPSLLGLSEEEARNLGLMSEPVPVTGAAPSSSKQQHERDATSVASNMEDARNLGLVSEPELLTAAASSPSPQQCNSAQRCGAYSCASVISACSNCFQENQKGISELTRQSSDVAYLLNDSVFWVLVRRLLAELEVLEAFVATGQGDDWGAAWLRAPFGRAALRLYAEERGYVLPDCHDTAVFDDVWRRALLMEVTSDLLLARIQARRGFETLAALAVGSSPSYDEEGDREDVSMGTIAKGVEAVAGRLIENMSQSAPVLSAIPGVSQGTPAARIGAIAAALASADSTSSSSAGSRGPCVGENTLVLAGNWSLLQEMSVREIALTLREEYTVRRQILLGRLDVTADAMCGVGTKVSASSKFRPQAMDILARMWAGWRSSAAKAPPLSEWSALAVSRASLKRLVGSRISGANTKTASKVRTMLIGKVPDRGGVPDSFRTAVPGAGTVDVSAAAPPRAGQKRPVPGTYITTISNGETTSGGASSSNGSGTGTSAEGPSRPARLGPKPERERKGTLVGARSTNKDLQNEYRAQQKLRLATEGPDYYQQLGSLRGLEDDKP